MPWEELAFGLTAFAATGAVVFVIVGGLIRLARKSRGAISGSDADVLPALRARLAELDAIQEHMAQLGERMVDLEERVDFAERLLSQQRVARLSERSE